VTAERTNEVGRRMCRYYLNYHGDVVVINPDRGCEQWAKNEDNGIARGFRVSQKYPASANTKRALDRPMKKILRDQAIV